jgi:hypothetical protein
MKTIHLPALVLSILFPAVQALAFDANCSQTIRCVGTNGAKVRVEVANSHIRAVVNGKVKLDRDLSASECGEVGVPHEFGGNYLHIVQSGKRPRFRLEVYTRVGYLNHDDRSPLIDTKMFKFGSMRFGGAVAMEYTLDSCEIPGAQPAF